MAGKGQAGLHWAPQSDGIGLQLCFGMRWKIGKSKCFVLPTNFANCLAPRNGTLQAPLWSPSSLVTLQCKYSNFGHCITLFQKIFDVKHVCSASNSELSTTSDVCLNMLRSGTIASMNCGDRSWRLAICEGFKMVWWEECESAVTGAISPLQDGCYLGDRYQPNNGDNFVYDGSSVNSGDHGEMPNGSTTR